MYKEKLILLLKALEVKEIKELIEQPPEYLAKIGVVIAKAAKIGAKVASQPVVEADAESRAVCPLCGLPGGDRIE